MSVLERIREQERKAVEGLIEYFGNQATLAAYLEVDRRVVNNWVTRGRISATAAAALEKKSGGKFKKSDLRPDVTNWYL